MDARNGKSTTSTQPGVASGADDRRADEREALIERAKLEVPALRETVKQNLSALRRIAGTGG